MKVPGEIEPTTLRRAVEQAFAVQIGLADAPAQGFADWKSLARVVAGLAVASGSRVIGISGSQGSGKSSLAQTLAAALNRSTNSAVACSLDDFYLTRQERALLAREVHPLLSTRGVPGTHACDWLREVLQSVHSGQRNLRIPQFDKGLDERAGTLDATADILILEGWCVGVAPQPEGLLAQPCNALERDEDAQGVWRGWVNAQITQHYQPLWAHVDLWLHLRVPGFAQVVAWREQQEFSLPGAQRMSKLELERFIAHYERLTRWQWRHPARGPGLLVQLDAQHGVEGVTVSAGTVIESQ